MTVKMELVCDGEKCTVPGVPGAVQTFWGGIIESPSDLRDLAVDAGWIVRTSMRRHDLRTRDLCPDCAEREVPQAGHRPRPFVHGLAQYEGPGDRWA